MLELNFPNKNFDVGTQLLDEVAPEDLSCRPNRIRNASPQRINLRGKFMFLGNAGTLVGNSLYIRSIAFGEKFK